MLALRGGAALEGQRAGDGEDQQREHPDHDCAPHQADDAVEERRLGRLAHAELGAHFDALDGRPGWLIEFRERERPTLVRTPEGRDQATRVVVLVDPQTGEVLQTTLTWERVEGMVAVYYGHTPGIPVPVPIRMAERYVTRTGALVGGEATYANFRQFETSARIIQ